MAAILTFLQMIGLAIFLIGSLLTGQINNLFIRHIADSTYLKDVFGNIYYDDGCQDLACLSKSYTPLRIADSHSFTPLTAKSPFSFELKNTFSGYARDKRDIYYLTNVVKEADTNSFQAIGHKLGQDIHQYYLEGIPLQNYINHHIDPSFNLKSITILSYKLLDYIIFKQNNLHYMLSLKNPMNIKEIPSEKANTYPPLH